MKKLNVAIIGQGRSGRDIHGHYFKSDKNIYYKVKYVVDYDENRLERAKTEYPGCEVLSNYKELYLKEDIDLVVNASYSDNHYSITKDLLEHRLNVLVEKPFARNRYECDDLIKTAIQFGVVLEVFQQTFFAPFYLDALRYLNDRKLGKIECVNIRYNGLSRRWDWQTLQKKMGGNAYNTGPHPIGIALGLLGFDENAKVEYSKLANTDLFSGDADSFVKIILSAPNKPVVDIEINNTDAYSDYNIKLQGNRGTFKATTNSYKLKYIVPSENEEHPVQETFIQAEDGTPVYCKENLISHEEEGKYEGTAFDVGTATLYENLYNKITKDEPLKVTPEMAARIIGVIEEIHAANPLPIKY